MRNIMLDTETLGLRPGFAIMSIAAIEFDLDGSNDRQYYANINPKSCAEAGLKQNPETRAWWSAQPEAVQNRLIQSRRPLKDVLVSFIDWFREVKAVNVWCQGAAFDVPIVEAAMDACGLAVPWKFWNVRDTRTVYDIAGLDTRDVPRAAGSQAHDARDDAMHQIACVAAAMRRIQRVNPGRLEDAF